MKEQIIKYLEHEKTAKNFKEIMRALDLSTANDYKQILKELKILVDELIIYETNKHNYILMQDAHLRNGILSTINSGNGFVKVEGETEDFFVDRSNLKGAINGDQVIIEVVGISEREKPEARVIKIIARNTNEVVGELSFKGGKAHVTPDDSKLNIDIIIDGRNLQGATIGHIVLVQLKKQMSQYKFKGEIKKIIGHKNDVGIDVLRIVYKHGINDIFSQEVMREVTTIPELVTDNDLVGRKDLRNNIVFTIDGDTAKDLDDAISIEELENGNFILGVHIADVSNYVKQGSLINEEALARGTSVYLVDRVIPMIPHALSNGICSLNELQDRLTISCEMTIDLKGEVISHDIFPSVINSKKRMTYKKVNDLLIRNIIDPTYAPFEIHLRKMEKLASILRKVKNRRGSLDFGDHEVEIKIDEKGYPVDVILRQREESERIIEDFMIIANETIATHFFQGNLPFLYRVHETPNEEKMNNFIQFLNRLGISITGNKNVSDPKVAQNILEIIDKNENSTMIEMLMLRSMQKAYYDPKNLKHYGLASDCYCHFTSPIRRYPDLTVHTLIRDMLFKHKTDIKNKEEWNRKLPVIAQHSSEMEKASVDCEREVDDMKMAEYMMTHIGEEFDGIISGVQKYGFFVELPNLIEGLVRLEALEGRYLLNEKDYTLVKEGQNIRYAMGDKVRVTVLKASKENGRIDFGLVKGE